MKELTGHYSQRRKQDLDNLYRWAEQSATKGLETHS